jgi:beta-mannanase
MGKKHDLVWNGRCEAGKLYGTLEVAGSIKHTTESEPFVVEWTCSFDGDSLKDVMQVDTAANIKVRMATMRELPYEELIAKRGQLQDATVAWKDIPSWTTKGQRGRKAIPQMSIEEVWAKMTPVQRLEMMEKAAAEMAKNE